MEYQRRNGNQWANIAKLLKGRTANAVKNRWNCKLRRQKKERNEQGIKTDEVSFFPISSYSPQKTEEPLQQGQSNFISNFKLQMPPIQDDYQNSETSPVNGKNLDEQRIVGPNSLKEIANLQNEMKKTDKGKEKFFSSLMFREIFPPPEDQISEDRIEYQSNDPFKMNELTKISFNLE